MQLTAGWKDKLIDALSKAGVTSTASPYTGKVTINMVDGGIRFVEMSQTVK